MQVLDADQAAFPDFLTKILPCMDAGADSDNVALIQSPQVLIQAPADMQGAESSFSKHIRIWPHS